MACSVTWLFVTALRCRAGEAERIGPWTTPAAPTGVAATECGSDRGWGADQPGGGAAVSDHRRTARDASRGYRREVSPRPSLLKHLTYPRLVAVDVLLSGMVVEFGH